LISANFLKKNRNFGRPSPFRAKVTIAKLGGLLKAGYFFDDNKPFLVHNIDILSNIDLNQLYDAHIRNNCISTLAVKNRNTSRSLLINGNNELCGWKNNQTGETKIPVENSNALSPIAFSAIHVMNPEIFPLITETGKFSIIDVYLRLIRNHKIMTFRHDNDFWFYIGRT
jgi:NDP-sugar pyrophosphorylase family protein